MSDALQQIRCSFLREEDRVLLEISAGNQSAYRLWLTRRFVKLLWPRLMGNLEKSPEVMVQSERRAKRAVMAFQKQEAVQASDLSQDYSQAGLSYPLGAAPILTTKFTLGSPQKNGVTPICFQAPNNVGITINLRREQLYTFCHLLSSATQKSDWDLNLITGDLPPTAPKHLH